MRRSRFREDLGDEGSEDGKMETSELKVCKRLGSLETHEWFR
jgi:hypothetical protein